MYQEKKGSNTMKTMLKVMPHAQATVEHKNDGTRELVSYQTKAATLTADGWLTVHCWCSPTTRRHIAAFIDEYAYGIQSKAEQARANTGSYQTAKALYEGNMRMDVNTGEVQDIV